MRPVNARGFSLIEMMITAAILAIVSLVAVTIITNVTTGARAMSSKASVLELTNALRLQLARRASCEPSMVQKPNSFGAASPIAIQMENGGPVVKAGARLVDEGLDVKSLMVQNLAAAGTTDGGDPVYLADVVLSVADRASATAERRDITISRLAMVVTGGSMSACYASDSYKDVTQQLELMCNRIRSPEGIPSTWVNGQCATRDVNIGSTCGSLGGAWNGSTCVFRHTSFIVSRTVPAYAYNDGTGYGVSCPPNSILTGGACTSAIPPRVPTSGMYLGGGYANYFGCAWEAGYEDTPYNVYAACLQ